MPNLLLIDDHTIIRTGMKMIIEKFLPDCNIDEAEDGNSMLDKIKHTEYDLLILDINMPDTDSFVLIKSVLALKPLSKILMLSMNSEEIYATRYLKAGAMGYVKKDAPMPEIKKAIGTVLANKKYISEALAEKLLNEIDDKHNFDNPFDKLSKREFEIVHYLLHGESLIGICNKLALKPSTVSTFKTRIFKKMHCSNVIELNTLAKVHKITDIS